MIDEDALYPDRWEADVALEDGATVYVRPIRASDRARLARFHGRQSRESIYFRYFSAHPTLTEAELSHFTEVDYHDRIGFVALLEDELVAVAGYEPWGNGRRAEVAFFVDDDHHGRGLATLLLEYLAVAAREAGYEGLFATVLPGNRGMIHVFYAAGFVVASRYSGGVVEVDLGLDNGPEAARLMAERARRAEAESVARLLRPQCIAVVGASRQAGTVGFETLQNIVAGGFTGRVYAVNEAGGSGPVPIVYSVEEIPEPLDLAIVAVPAERVVDVVARCAGAGAASVVVLSDGVDVAALQSVASRFGVRLLGPSSVGLINTDPAVSLRATFAASVPLAGSAGLSVQAGSLGAAILALVQEVGLGLSAFFSLGEKADISGNDLLQFWYDDEATRVVLLYVESFGNPRRFFRVARQLARRKPIAAVSVAGVLAGDVSIWPSEAGYSALLAQAGVIEVATLAQLMDLGRLLGEQPLPAGRRVGVVANAVSPTRLVSVAAVRAGLEVTRQEVLSADVSPGDLAAAVGALREDQSVDAVIVLYAAPVRGEGETVAAAIDAQANGAKPILATIVEGPGPPQPGGLGRATRFRFPEDAVGALARAARYVAWRHNEEAGNVDALADLSSPVPSLAAVAIVQQALGVDPRPQRLGLDQAHALLTAYGISVLAQQEVSFVGDAVAAAVEMGFPVVLKAGGRGAISRDIATGLALDLDSAAAVATALARIRSAVGSAADVVVVQKMGRSGVDAQVVASSDSRVGPVVAVGRGGSARSPRSELAVRLAPLSQQDAWALVNQSPLTELVDPDSANALAGLIEQVGRIVADLPEVATIILDPVLVAGGGCDVTDYEIWLAPTGDLGAPPVRRL